VATDYDREVIDCVSIDGADRLRADYPARRLVARRRWPLLPNRENVTLEADQVRLRKVPTAERALMIADVLKYDLKEL
jgi:transposase